MTKPCQSPPRSWVLAAISPMIGLVFWVSGGHGQEPPRAARPAAESHDRALRRKVDRLVDQLDAATARSRQEAQEALVRLGPVILPVLPRPTGTMTAEQARRLRAVRNTLEEEQARQGLQAAVVTIHAKDVPLSEAIRQIVDQTGNAVELGGADADGGPAANPKLHLDLDRVPFWKALDVICNQAGLSANLYTGEHKIILAPGATKPIPTSTSGPFRVDVKAIALKWDAEQEQSTGTINFSVAWEPRLDPLVLQVRPADLHIVDDRGHPLAAAAPKEKLEIPVDPSTIVMDLPLPIVPPGRQARKLSAVRGQFTLITPAAMQTFRFKDLLQARNVARKTQDVRVVLQKFATNGPFWTADILIEYEPSGLAGQLDTHIDWTANNQIVLVKPDGTRFEHNGGLQTTIQEPGRIGIQYIFTDAPGKPEDWELVYKTPGRLVAAPVWLNFRDLPLP